MIGLDTNVLLRFLVDDDNVEQSRAARALLSGRNGDEPVFISAVTLAETVWVLTKKLDYAISDVAVVIRKLLAGDGVHLEHDVQLGVLLGRGKLPSAELADHLIAWSGHAVGCSRTVTFDRRAARAISEMELLG